MRIQTRRAGIDAGEIVCILALLADVVGTGQTVGLCATITKSNKKEHI